MEREKKWSTMDKISFGAGVACALCATIFSPKTRKFVKNFWAIKPGQNLPYQKFVKLHEDTNILRMGRSTVSVNELEQHARAELDIGESLVYGRKSARDLFEGPYADLDKYMSSEHLRILRTGKNDFKYMDISTNGTKAGHDIFYEV